MRLGSISTLGIEEQGRLRGKEDVGLPQRGEDRVVERARRTERPREMKKRGRPFLAPAFVTLLPRECARSVGQR